MSAGTTRHSNHGLRLSQSRLRGLGCGIGQNSGYQGSGWYMMNYAEEGAANCPGSNTYTNTITFDHDILINDNVGDTGSPSPEIVCMIATSADSSGCSKS